MGDGCRAPSSPTPGPGIGSLAAVLRPEASGAGSTGGSACTDRPRRVSGFVLGCDLKVDSSGLRLRAGCIVLRTGRWRGASGIA